MLACGWGPPPDSWRYLEPSPGGADRRRGTVCLNPGCSRYISPISTEEWRPRTKSSPRFQPPFYPWQSASTPRPPSTRSYLRSRSRRKHRRSPPTLQLRTGCAGDDKSDEKFAPPPTQPSHRGRYSRTRIRHCGQHSAARQAPHRDLPPLLRGMLRGVQHQLLDAHQQPRFAALFPDARQHLVQGVRVKCCPECPVSACPVRTRVRHKGCSPPAFSWPAGWSPLGAGSVWRRGLSGEDAHPRRAPLIVETMPVRRLDGGVRRGAQTRDPRSRANISRHSAKSA